MNKKGAYIFSALSILLISIIVSVFLSKEWVKEKRNKEVISDLEDEIGEWRESSIRRYSDLVEIKRKCQRKSEILSRKKVLSQITDEDIISKKIKEICEGVEKITRNSYKIEKAEEKINDIEREIKEINFDIDNFERKSINIVKEIDSGRGPMYIIAASYDNTFGVISEQASLAGELRAGTTRELLVDRVGSRRILMRRGETKTLDEFKVVSIETAKNIDRKLEVMKSKKKEINKSLVSLRFEALRLAEEEIGEGISYIKDTLDVKSKEGY